MANTRCKLFIAIVGPAMVFQSPVYAAQNAQPKGRATQIQQTFHVPNPLPSLDVGKHGSFEVEPGIVADRVTYNTQLNMRVPAIVYHPADTSVKRPAIIIVNGHGGDKYTWYAFYAGVMYARAGAVVVTYDPIGEGERNGQHKSGTRAHDKYVPPDENGRWMGGLMMTDIRQATSYLLQRPDVDANRIAMAGYSMGSFVTSWACAVETRVHACAPTAGAVLDEPGGTLDSSSKKMCQAIPYQSLQFLGDRGPAIFALAAQHAAVLIHNGSSDEVVNIPTHGEAFFRDMRDRTAKLLGPDSKKVFEYSFTPDGGHRPYFITRPVAEWFNKQLHFPNWEAISHDETHISEWAARNNVPMDKMYATEHREGGAIALGKDIPYVTHDQLNVLPESEWQTQKDKFILETWLERVRQSSPSPSAQ
jgi:dienelactone hydrolase